MDFPSRLTTLRRLFLAAAAVVAFAAGCADLLALTDEEMFREFNFYTITAGARAQAMGGAFVATGDDSTALLANPAALDFVTEHESFIEFRSISSDPRVLRSNFGSLAVDPTTGARDLPFLGLTSATETDQADELSFLGFTLPFKVGRKDRRLNLAGSRQVILAADKLLAAGSARTEARFAFDSFPNTVAGSEVVAYSVDTPVSGGSSGDIVYWNIGASFEAHPDFSIGATVSFAELEFQAATLTRVIDPLQLFVDPSHPRLPGRQTTDFFETRIDDTDSDVVYTIGVHWHPDSVFASGDAPWGLGAVFRKGAEFSVKESTFLNQVPVDTFENAIIVPDSYGLGVSFRTPEHWTFTVELDRIELSDMMEGFVTGVNVLTGDQIAGAFGTDPDVEVLYTIEDDNVFRAGAEYVHPLGGKADRLLQLWGGYFRSPDSRIRMTQFNSTDPDVNAVYLDAFRGADAEDHYTFGAGVTVGRHSFRLSGETSDLGDQVVGNYILRLGG